MAHDLMYECHQKRPFLNSDGSKTLRWVPYPVSALDSGLSRGVRCMHCHGAVRVHKQKVPHGPRDHVEHRSRQDSEGCRGGAYFKGEHRMSLMPVDWTGLTSSGCELRESDFMRTMAEGGALTAAAFWLLDLYQRIAPSTLRRCCRYEPTCSDYMKDALGKYAFSVAVWMGVRRIIRCRPPYGGRDSA